MSDKIQIRQLKCGITAITQEMPSVKTAALNIKLPCGSAFIDEKHAGAGSVLAEWLFRGTQELTSKELVGKLDGMGLHRSSSAASAFINLSAAMESSNLLDAMELYAQIIKTPRFTGDQLELSKQNAIGELTALDDDPRQKVMLKLKEQFYPKPYNHNPMGTVESLESLNAEICSKIYTDNLDASKMIMSFAGNIEPDKIFEKIEELFGDFEYSTQNQLDQLHEQKPTYRHIQNDGAQIHIGLICPASTMADENYYNTMLASTILGGGMSSRLFTEVREKRGLCYAVGARYQAIKSAAGIGCYAGTVPEKAQETLDLIIEQFSELGNGVTEDELERAKVGLKSSLVMSSESSSARSSNLGSDFYMLGRVRTLDEIKNKIDTVSVEEVSEFLKNNPYKNFTICTIGPNEIQPPKQK